jgi:hypothetical protein
LLVEEFFNSTFQPKEFDFYLKLCPNKEHLQFCFVMV